MNSYLLLVLSLSSSVCCRPVDILAVEVEGFTALPFPLFRGFILFPFPIAPLFFPPGATLRTWGFAFAFVLVTIVGCCNEIFALQWLPLFVNPCISCNKSFSNLFACLIQHTSFSWPLL